jgi:hypothetical protein
LAKNKSSWKHQEYHIHPMMSLFVAFIVLMTASLIVFAQRKDNNAQKGFDAFGYNEQANIFVGDADGVDRMLNGKVWGDAFYTNDHLKMKWNDEWNRGNNEGWTMPPYNAHLDNSWNGKVPGGSGEVWHYKMVWTGKCTDGEAVFTDEREEGYCIWGQFAVIMSQGSINEHFWEAHAKPKGYGVRYQGGL